MTRLSLTLLEDLAVLEARGPDTVRFLQGQVSHDLSLLAARGSLLAGLHNPQGRVLALLRLLHHAPDHVLMVLPASLATSTRQHLARYVLRARVALEDVTSSWQVIGASEPEAATSPQPRMPAGPGSPRQLILAPRTGRIADADAAGREAWRLADIREGIPEIGAELSGLFVAQMLNLDVLDAISFSKGCYTGQEVIARAHYRGQVKRRMQRFGTGQDSVMTPGQRVRLPDGRALQIVMAARDPAGAQEFLAVGPLATGAGSAAPETGDESALIEASPLPLPYELPD